MKKNKKPTSDEKSSIEPVKQEKRKLFSARQKKVTTPDNFDVGVFNAVDMKAGSVRFAGLYNKHAKWKRYLIAAIIGVVMAILIQFTLKNTGLYNSGLSAIAQGLARITNTAMINSGGNAVNLAPTVFNIMFWGLYGVLNIPLLIFGYKKIGHTFCWLTMVFMIVNIAVGLAISYIPGANNILLFGNTISAGDTATGKPNVFVNGGVYVIPFWYVPKGGDPTIYDINSDPYKALFLFIYAFIYGIGAALAYGILYIIGGCSGGGDFVSIYRASVKHKPLGGVLIIINSSCLITGSIIGSYIPAGMINSQGYNFEFLLSANLVASFLSVVIMGFMLNRWYPMHRIVKIEISSEKIMEIRNHLFEAKFTHSMSISKTKGAYSGLDKDVLWTICMYVEMPRVIRHVKMIDPAALVIVTTVTDLEGRLKIYRQGSTE